MDKATELRDANMRQIASKDGVDNQELVDIPKTISVLCKKIRIKILSN